MTVWSFGRAKKSAHGKKDSYLVADSSNTVNQGSRPVVSVPARYASVADDNQESTYHVQMFRDSYTQALLKRLHDLETKLKIRGSQDQRMRMVSCFFGSILYFF